MNYIIMVTVLLLDQLSKILTLRYLKEVREIPIIENIFHLTYVENRGAAFGILANQKWFFVITATLLVTAALIFLHTKKDIPKLLSIGLSLVVGGAVGNLIDRLLYGFVVDFFDFRIWPVFNIADCAIVIGAILIGFVIIKYDV